MLIRWEEKIIPGTGNSMCKGPGVYRIRKDQRKAESLGPGVGRLQML